MQRAPLTPKETLAYYPTAGISVTPKERPETYIDKLLVQKFSLIEENYRGGVVVDLCCGNGSHLFKLAGTIDSGIGVDFVPEFVDSANAKAQEGKLSNIEFIVSDARSLPLDSHSADLIYSLSALYVVPELSKVISEISRVLTVGGRCVLDLGNSNSLNALCVPEYRDAAPLTAVSVSEMLRACRSSGLSLVERRSFQILPLWADKPRWMRPLLAPFWANFMKMSFRGRLLDEWISSLPVLNRFAFRQIIVCEKLGAAMGRPA